MQSTSEIYFIVAMMILILIGCIVAVTLFIRTYRKEKEEREKEARRIASLKQKSQESKER